MPVGFDLEGGGGQMAVARKKPQGKREVVR